MQKTAIFAPFLRGNGETLPIQPDSNQPSSEDAALYFDAPNAAGFSLGKAGLKLRAESFQVPKSDSLSDLPHHVKVKVEIMVGVQDDREKFSRAVEMP